MFFNNYSIQFDESEQKTDTRAFTFDLLLFLY